MNWIGKNVLVTGAGGFIGSHLVERLVEIGAKTSAFVHYNAQGSAGWLDQSPQRTEFEIIAGDICDRDTLARAVKGKEVIFHLAALIGIPYSYEAPYSYVRTNVEGTLNLLRVCLEADVERVIHTSTSEVYGTSKSDFIREDHVLQAKSPYSASKIGADKLAEAFYFSYHLPVSIMRPFNTYGPRQTPRAIIPTIIQQALTKNEIRLGNLEPKRDFTLVTDTVDGFIRMAETGKTVGETIHIGSGKAISIGELATLILTLMNCEKAIVSDSERFRPEKSEVDYLCADIANAKKLIGWEPRHLLREGLMETINWMERNLGSYQQTAYRI